MKTKLKFIKGINGKLTRSKYGLVKHCYTDTGYWWYVDKVKTFVNVNDIEDSYYSSSISSDNVACTTFRKNPKMVGNFYWDSGYIGYDIKSINSL